MSELDISELSSGNLWLIPLQNAPPGGVGPHFWGGRFYPLDGQPVKMALKFYNLPKLSQNGHKIGFLRKSKLTENGVKWVIYFEYLNPSELYGHFAGSRHLRDPATDPAKKRSKWLGRIRRLGQIQLAYESMKMWV